MKKKNGMLFSILSVVLTLGMYLVFYSSIETKPGDAGFWLIIALGMSIGVALTRIFQWSKGTAKK